MPSPSKSVSIPFIEKGHLDVLDGVFVVVVFPSCMGMNRRDTDILSITRT
jgi:hypothetical protein